MAEQDSVATAASQIHMKVNINVTWNAVAIVFGGHKADPFLSNKLYKIEM